MIAVPSIDDNRAAWSRYDWTRSGDEWSSAWGSSRNMWFGSILPRIQAALPARSLLEIAPGYGRVTGFLLDHCERYVGVDLAENCVAACRVRFADRPNAQFEINDGLTLGAVGNATIDFAFSWDSLVHADAAVLSSYVGELARALRPGGRAFLHHSNLAAFADPTSGELTVANPHWRDATTSAAGIRAACRDAGLSCEAQELVQWGSPDPIDCFSWLCRPRDGEPQNVADVPDVHPDFSAESSHFRRIGELYATARDRAGSDAVEDAGSGADRLR